MCRAFSRRLRCCCSGRGARATTRATFEWWDERNTEIATGEGMPLRRSWPRVQIAIENFTHQLVIERQQIVVTRWFSKWRTHLAKGTRTGHLLESRVCPWLRQP